MANKETAKKTKKKATVLLFQNKWADRHGDRGETTTPYGNANRARIDFGQDIKRYLTDLELLDGDKLELASITSFETDSLKWEDDTLSILNRETKEFEEVDTERGVTLLELTRSALQCGWLEIDKDGEGTKSSWSLTKEEIL